MEEKLFASPSRPVRGSSADQELVPVLDTDRDPSTKGDVKEISGAEEWRELRRVLAVGLLVLAQVLTSSAYSALASFFPLEVGSILSARTRGFPGSAAVL